MFLWYKIIKLIFFNSPSYSSDVFFLSQLKTFSRWECVLNFRFFRASFVIIMCSLAWQDLATLLHTLSFRLDNYQLTRLVVILTTMIIAALSLR